MRSSSPTSTSVHTSLSRAARYVATVLQAEGHLAKRGSTHLLRTPHPGVAGGGWPTEAVPMGTTLGRRCARISKRWQSVCVVVLCVCMCMCVCVCVLQGTRKQARRTPLPRSLGCRTRMFWGTAAAL